MSDVVGFYDTHPIHEAQILEKLRERGISPDALTEEALKDHDQDHYGGLEAVDALAAAAGIEASTRVLDVCSGVGGPARYLAWRLGCRVTGIDLTASRHAAAERLTRLVGLDHLVDFHFGDALDLPFADASFDVVIGQEAWAHVPSKQRLVAEAARVTRPGGRIAFTDILAGAPLAEPTMRRLSEGMAFASLATADEYRRLLGAAGCRVVLADDLSAEWTAILQARLEMFRSLRGTTVARFGEAHFRRWDETYAFFVGLFARRELGGGRFVAVKGQVATGVSGCEPHSAQEPP